MPIEVESPEQLGYDTITNNLSESSVADRRLGDLGLDLASASTTYCSVTAITSVTRCSADAVAAGGDGIARRRRARHAGRGRRALRDGDGAPRSGRSRRGRAHQLRDEPRDAARDRRRSRHRRSRVRRAAGRSTSTRIAARVRAGRDAVDLRHVPAQPDRARCSTSTDARTRSSKLAERSGAVLLVDETYRDLTHGELASARGVAVAACDQRRVDVEGVRAAGAAGRLGGVPRPQRRRVAAGREGTDGDLRRDARRSDRGRACSPIASASCRRSSTTRGAGSPSCATGWRARTCSSGSNRAGGVVGLVRFRPDVAVDTGSLLRGAARRARHVRRSRSLVRARRSPLPARLRLADALGTARGSRRAVRVGRRTQVFPLRKSNGPRSTLCVRR